jgi:hypothetical protein
MPSVYLIEVLTQSSRDAKKRKLKENDSRNVQVCHRRGEFLFPIPPEKLGGFATLREPKSGFRVV